jgi:hypothetical protein
MLLCHMAHLTGPTTRVMSHSAEHVMCITEMMLSVVYVYLQNSSNQSTCRQGPWLLTAAGISAPGTAY